MSLLAKMRIGVASAAAPAPGGLTLDESEVRTLIALAEDDLRSADDIENLPFGFADLHRAVSGLLPQLTIEELAETYTQVYQGQPDALVAKVMMGQPLEPETRLTRAQIWLLLMDGFAGPGGADAAYGAADRVLPDLPSPNPAWSAAEWREALARLPLVAASRVLAVEHADAGTTLRLAPQPPALLSRLSGKPLVATRTGSLAGQEVTWELADESRAAGTRHTQHADRSGHARRRQRHRPLGRQTGRGVGRARRAGAGVGWRYRSAARLPAGVECVQRASADVRLRHRSPARQGGDPDPVAHDRQAAGADRLSLRAAAADADRRRQARRVSTPPTAGSCAGPNGTLHRHDGRARCSRTSRCAGPLNCASTTMSARQQLHVEGRMLPAGTEPGTGAQGGAGWPGRETSGRYHWATPDLGNIATQGFVLGASWEQQPPADGLPRARVLSEDGAGHSRRRPMRSPDHPVACLPLIEGDAGADAGTAPTTSSRSTTRSGRRRRAGYAIGLRRARDYYFVDDNNEVGHLGAIASSTSRCPTPAGGGGRPRWTVTVQRPSLAP